MAKTKEELNGGTIRATTTHTHNHGGIFTAKLIGEGQPKMKATCTGSARGAVLNLAYRFFFGTAKHTEFPDSPEQIKVKSVGNAYEATYTPSVKNQEPKTFAVSAQLMVFATVKVKAESEEEAVKKVKEGSHPRMEWDFEHHTITLSAIENAREVEP